MLDVTEFPAFVIQPEAGGKKKFQVEGELTAKNIIQHVEDVKAGKLVAKLKSEPVPEEQGDVKVVVGETLKEQVFSETKDVLFEVYAPWCGHCKSLEPHYEKLAKKVVSDIDQYVSIAKMDGTANDSPVDSITWSGFPTIVYVKAGSQEVLKYDGPRTAEGMWKWVKENSSHKDAIQSALEAKHGADATDKHDEL
jgi:protein disulfide-isomerase/protein disulfide-isomerase A1